MDSNLMESIATANQASGARARIERWTAERENASARIELARIDEARALLISQHEPVHSLGMDRNALRVLLAYVRHGDVARMKRELDALTTKEIA